MARFFTDTNNERLQFDNINTKFISNHTISMWVQRRGSGDSFGAYFFNGAINTSLTLAQDGSSTDVLYRLTIASVLKDLVVSDVLELGNWVHLLATYDGVNQKLFKNGIEVGTRAQTGTLDAPGTGFSFIGGHATNRTLKSVLAEVGIWDVPLSLGEINGLSRGAKPNTIRRRSLKEYYPMEGKDFEPSLTPNGQKGIMVGTSLPAPHPGFLKNISPVRYEQFIEEVVSAGTFTQAVIVG